MELVIDVDVTAPREALDQIRGRLDQPRTLLQRMGLLLEEYEREVFATRGHGQWQTLDPATVDLKSSGQVLVDAGDLLGFLTTATVENDDTVAVNQGDAFYGRFLRDGDRGMPRRDPAPEPPHDTQEQWADEVLAFLTDGLA